MPRKKHEWYIGAKVHVIARGNHRNDIFRDVATSALRTSEAPPGETGFSKYK